ncbi:MAG: NADH:ubiquinone oxidoreductase subunit [Desulfobulbaceae bacterium]|nr:MAG: NADH:ubiquinone oxidoreductase subunit [Desulfobulbaceae bacterium]
MDTTTISSAKLLITLLVPLMGTIGVLLYGKDENFREGISSVTSIVLFLLVASMIPTVLSGKTLVFQMFNILPGLSVTLRADAMSMIFALVASSLWTIAVFYSMGYMRAHNEHAQTRFNACFALAIFGAIGVAFSDNIFTMYLFYEIVSICTYPLVAHNQDEKGYSGARKYIIYLTTTAKLLFLPAMILIFVLVGNLDFANNTTSGILPANIDKNLVLLLFLFCLFGLAKNGVMPFHHWLPGAMVAPTPVSALLHAVAVVKVGVFCTSRVMLYVFGTDMLHKFHLDVTGVCIVITTITLASIIALTKDNLKERLAYSTISQLSYILVGVFLLSNNGITGGVIHIANHAFAKITLFWCAGAIFIASHKTNISQLDGLAKKMPFTMGAFTIGAFSMIGMPLFAGFISKWYLLQGALDANQMLIVGFLLFSTILNAGYFIPPIYAAFFKKLPAGETSERAEAPWAMVIPIMLTASLTMYLFFNPSLFISLAQAMLP